MDATKDSDVENSFQFVSSFNTADDAETLFTISTLKQTTVFRHFGLNGRLTLFQLDSGASCNVLREKDIDLPRQYLQPTKTKLRVYNGVNMQPLGQVKASITNPVTEETFKMDFLVVSEASTAILGAKACQEMSLISVHRDKFLEDSNSLSTAVHGVDGGIHTAQDLTKQLPITSRADLIAAYNVIFNGQLGRFDGQVHLEVSRDARQVVMPTRRVPLAMEDRLASELSRWKTWA